MLYALAIGLLSLSIALLVPTWRRVLVFHLHAGKYAGIWLLDLCRIRRLWLRLRGRRPVPIDLPLLLRRFCEDMGPTFIKFGQIVASSAGMFPDRYVQEFQKCLDRVRPFPFAQVKQILGEELGELGVRALSDIDPTPLASASIAQVHRARLHDGSDVVIKVQRPGIADQVEADMRILRAVAWLAARLVKDAELANPVGIVEDFAATLSEELDFRREATNLRHFNEIMADFGQAQVRAPTPNPVLTSAKVLVMERFSGTRVDCAEQIFARGVDAEAALVTGLRAWLQCVVLRGFFHGDVHAGNLMLLDDGDVGFLDFGIIGRFDRVQRRLVTDYMLAFSMGNYRKLAEVIVAMGGVPDGLDMEAFARDLGEVFAPIRGAAFGDVNYAELLPGIQRVSTRHRMRLPREFVLILKQFLYFDRYAKLLAPHLNVFTDPRLILGLQGDIQKARAESEALRAAA
ncbi:ABC1 kinase family protein [Haliangium sp.]|uniref:ABC1 kinase family protein n=1 Tax=Haliangium sp. TaxID=2663208 RepID=UPI003D13A567